MTDPRHNKPDKEPKTYWEMFKAQGGAATLIILALVLGAEIGAFAYGQITSQLNREGIVTQATVLALEQFEETTLRSENSSSLSGDIVTLVSYEFRTEAEEVIKDTYRSENLAVIPVIGEQFDIRYAESDPNVHETRIGSTQSNVDALHWIAAVFALISAGYAAYCAFAAYKLWNSPAQKRRRRLAELS